MMGYWCLDNAYTTFSHAASFGYDNVNRMTSAVASAVASGSVSYNLTYGYTNDNSNGQYGNVSCLQNSQTNGPCTTVTFNPATNQMATIAGSGTGIRYDAAGNLLADGNGTFSTSATYDAEGRQTSTLQYGYGSTFTYNALGQRVERSCSWNPYPYDDYFDAFGNLTLNVYQGGSQIDYMPPVAGRRYAEYANGAVFTHANALGSIGLVTDHAGNPYGETLYYPWGQTWAETGTGVSIFADMQYQDWATGFYFTPNRVYDWQYYRWMTPDRLGAGQHPEDPQTWNLYAYARNNPVTLTDPTGQYVCDKSLTHEQCDNFQQALDAAQQSANNLKEEYGENSEQYQSVQRAIDAYGQEGVDNGVTIALGATGDWGAETQASGVAGEKTRDNPTGQQILVTFSDENASLFNGQNTDRLARKATHEGSHAADASDWVESGFSDTMNPTVRQTELDAYRVSLFTATGMGAQFMTFKQGGSSWSFLLPISQPATDEKLKTMIDAVYPDAGNAEFRRNTKIKMPQ